MYSIYIVCLIVTCICRGNWKEKCWTECRNSRNKSNSEVSGPRTRWFITASGRENRGNNEPGGKKNTAGMLRCFFYNCVHSIKKSGFRFWNPGFGFSIDWEIWKRISTLRNLFLDFLSFLSFFGNPKKDLKNCSYKQRSRTRTHNYSRKKTTVHETVLQIRFFGFPKQAVKKEMQNIWIWIS